MSRLTVRLPDTLHQRLEDLAKQEGVSLNQYIMYALTQQTTLVYTPYEVTAEKIAEQRANYETRIRRAHFATPEEIDQVLGEREIATLEPELTPMIVQRVRERIAAAHKTLPIDQEAVVQ